MTASGTASTPSDSRPHATWRSTNLGTLLFAASSWVIGIKLAAVHAAGFTDVTVAQLGLFHALDPAGTRLTLLATRAGLSKASIAELVDRAEAAGLVVRRPDRADARGRIVTATVAGGALQAALAAGLVAAATGVVQRVGPAGSARLHTGLGRYFAGGKSLPPETDAGWAAANVGRLFALAAARFTAEVSAVVAARGFAVTPALLGMVRHLDIDGSRLTDLAAAARMTKPAMRELVDRGESLGFIVRRNDPTDGRAQQIMFTPDGLSLLEAVRDGVIAAEAGLAATVGAAAVADLRVLLAGLTPIGTIIV